MEHTDVLEAIARGKSLGDGMAQLTARIRLELNRSLSLLNLAFHFLKHRIDDSHDLAAEGAETCAVLRWAGEEVSARLQKQLEGLPEIKRRRPRGKNELASYESRILCLVVGSSGEDDPDSVPPRMKWSPSTRRARHRFDTLSAGKHTKEFNRRVRQLPMEALEALDLLEIGQELETTNTAFWVLFLATESRSGKVENLHDAFFGFAFEIRNIAQRLCSQFDTSRKEAA
jgi:hypothetical protein